MLWKTLVHFIAKGSLIIWTVAAAYIQQDSAVKREFPFNELSTIPLSSWIHWLLFSNIEKTLTDAQV